MYVYVCCRDRQQNVGCGRFAVLHSALWQRAWFLPASTCAQQLLLLRDGGSQFRAWICCAPTMGHSWGRRCANLCPGKLELERNWGEGVWGSHLTATVAVPSQNVSSKSLPEFPPKKWLHSCENTEKYAENQAQLFEGNVEGADTWEFFILALHSWYWIILLGIL
jgi:hypothetical protein